MLTRLCQICRLTGARVAQAEMSLMQITHRRHEAERGLLPVANLWPALHHRDRPYESHRKNVLNGLKVSIR